MLTPAIPFADLEHFWNFDSHNLPSGGARVAPGTKSDFLNINDNFFEAVGSTTNRKPFRALDKTLNGLKGRALKINEKGNPIAPVSDAHMEEFIEDAINSGVDEEAFLNPLRSVSYSPGYTLQPVCLVAGDIQDASQGHPMLWWRP